MIHQDATEPELLHAVRLTGMTTLLDDALNKVRDGITTCDEVLRVFGPQNMARIRCTYCGGLMEQRYTYCPYCGRELINLCRECGQLMTKDWRHCPKCGTAAADTSTPTSSPAESDPCNLHETLSADGSPNHSDRNQMMERAK